MISEFLTITKRKSYILEFQFSDNYDFIKYLKYKIPGRYRKFKGKEKHKDKLYRDELERNIWYYEIHRKYWKRICKMLKSFFRKIYIIKSSITYMVYKNKVVNITNVLMEDDKEVYPNDYEKKKYKVYRDR